MVFHRFKGSHFSVLGAFGSPFRGHFGLIFQGFFDTSSRLQPICGFRGNVDFTRVLQCYLRFQPLRNSSFFDNFHDLVGSIF